MTAFERKDYSTFNTDGIPSATAVLAYFVCSGSSTWVEGEEATDTRQLSGIVQQERDDGTPEQASSEEGKQ